MISSWVLHRWRFAIDGMVVATVGLVVAMLSAESISWTAAGCIASAAVFVGGVCARSYGRAVTRALLAVGVTLAVVLGGLGFASGFGELTDSFETSDDSAPGLAAYWSLFAAGVLVPAVLTALTAQALAAGWRTRNDAGYDL